MRPPADSTPCPSAPDLGPEVHREAAHLLGKCAPHLEAGDGDTDMSCDSPVTSGSQRPARPTIVRPWDAGEGCPGWAPCLFLGKHLPGQVVPGLFIEAKGKGERCVCEAGGGDQLRSLSPGHSLDLHEGQSGCHPTLPTGCQSRLCLGDRAPSRQARGAAHPGRK